jgi:hypothetical protein
MYKQERCLKTPTSESSRSKAKWPTLDSVLVSQLMSVIASAFTRTETPWFQTSFLPDFRQVNFIFCEMVVCPSFLDDFPEIVHAAPVASTLKPRTKHIARDKRTHFTFESINAVLSKPHALKIKPEQVFASTFSMVPAHRLESRRRHRLVDRRSRFRKSQLKLLVVQTYSRR